ncbi:MAG: ParA family protein [Planctomycetes bacterium]|nr:ParA family protein [Planctomycetota bacterium]
MAAKIIAFMNQKGGVGKTTTTVNVGAVLATEYGRRVLLVDLDPQGNLSDHVGLDPNATEDSIYNVLIDGMDPRRAIRRVHGLETLPANLDLSGAEVELAGMDDRTARLRNALAGIRDHYDYILMDCPPSLGILTVSGLAAADAVIVAMEAEYLALRGISQLLHTVQRVGEAMRPGLEVAGVVFCMFDGRTTLAREVKAEVERYLPGKVFRTAVRKNVRLAEAPSRGLPVIAYDPRCAGSDDYREVAREFLERFEGLPPVPEVEVESGDGRDILAETPIVPEDDGRGAWQRQPVWKQE